MQRKTKFAIKGDSVAIKKKEYGIINILSLDEENFGWLVVVLQNYFIVVVFEDLCKPFVQQKFGEIACTGIFF